MIKTSNLNKMFDEVIKGNILTTEKLIECGFEFNDIINLIKKDFLIQLGKDRYELKKAEDLYLYGVRLIKMGESRARECFEKCYELDPNNSNVSFQLFFYNIKDKNYEEAFKYLKVMLNTNNIYESKDNNLYLYLLSIIIDIPLEYRDKVKKLKFQDIELLADDTRYDDVLSQNYVRHVAFDNKFFYAVEKLRDTVELNTFTFRDKILKTLLFQAGDADKLRKNKLLELAKYKEYDNIIAYYEEQKQKRKLGKTDKYILKLTEQILNVRKTLELPERKDIKTKNLFHTIDAQNYKKALKLSEAYIKKGNISANTIHILLWDLCETMNVISVLNSIFSNIKLCFENQDYTSMIKTLKNYLESIDKAEYEDLVIDYIKLSLYENDLNFNKVTKLLYQIITNEFEVNMNNYLEEFYNALRQNNFNVAFIYLDIISKLNKPVADKIKEELPPISNNNKNEKVMAIQDTVDEIKDEQFKSKEEIYVDSKYKELLKNKGIILLEPMKEDKIKRICDIVKTYPDMQVFTIENDKGEQIVLRYKYRNQSIIDYGKLLLNAEMAYEDKEYDICISYYLQLLQYGKPKIKTFARIGQCYLMLGQLSLALDYLTVATALSKLSDKQYDFTDEINELRKSQNTLAMKFKKLILSISSNRGDQHG